MAGVNGKVKDEVKATGAVVTGRRTFELADDWGGDHHDGHPIFALTRREPGSETGQWPLITYATDVRTAMTEAKQAAGDKNVLVHGAGTAQLALAAGVLDELEIHLIPVLLGQGRRLLLFAFKANRQPPRLSAIFRSAPELSRKGGPAQRTGPSLAVLPRGNMAGEAMPARAARGDHYMKVVLTPLLTPLTALHAETSGNHQQRN